MKRFKSFGLLAGLFLCTPILGGADGGCDIIIGDGDGDGDGDVGDGDGDGDGDTGDGDGDGDGSCTSDADCGPDQLCAIPDCAAICEQDPNDPDNCVNNCPTEGECIDINPGPCAYVDCAPGYRCEVETLCWDGDCTEPAPPPGDEPNDDERDPNQDPIDCGGGCEETAVCIPDDIPGECYDDADCGPGFHCSFDDHWGGAPPDPECWDENGDGYCDDGFVQPAGFCEPIDEPSACDLIDCGPGEECVEETYCTGLPYPCDCAPGEDCECGDYEDECFTDAYCVPVNTDDCYDIDPDQCYQTPGCHLEEVYPPCAAPEPCYDEDGDGQCDDTDLPIECEPILMCVPDYEPPQGSCQDRCGEVGSSGQCFCDDLCTQYGDCCEDFYDFCEDVVPPGCNSDDECGPNAYCDYREYCYDDFGNGEECFVEGVCIPHEPQDPCNQFPADICNEIEGCELLEVPPYCEPGPDGDVICDDGFENICVSSQPPQGCFDAAGQDLCGPDGQCVSETYCLDYCDQTVPDPECCFTESWCEYNPPPPPPNGCFGDDGQELCGEGERCEEVTYCEDFCMDANGEDCCFTETMCVPDETDPPVCIQVETEATNPQTGNCVVFPTPCDVPDHWELGCGDNGGDPDQP